MRHISVIGDDALDWLHGPVRLRTLTALRWLAVAGQTIAIVIVHFALGFPVPLGLSLSVIAASAWLNLFAAFRYSPQRMLSPEEAAGYICFDIVELVALIFLTGGLQNPFSALILAPVVIAASVLPLRQTIIIGVLAIVGVGFLALFHMPLPWLPGETLDFPHTFLAGVWVALTLSILFFATYAHRVAKESEQMRSALAATELVLAREERLAAIGALAAAAAHELGTPLATIQITAKEMASDLKGQGQLEDDAKLLVSQTERCRDILGRLSRRGDEGDVFHDRIRIDSLMKEAADPFINRPDSPIFLFEVSGCADETSAPLLTRKSEIIYGLRNFIENAAAFALTTVRVSAEIGDDSLTISVLDDGPGFAPEVIARLGEPYVSMRTHAHSSTGRKNGMGLGFFIAKTLLERTGAKVLFDNRRHAEDDTIEGARVSARWPLEAIAADSANIS